VRAESLLLKAKVERDMPRLTAHLVPSSESEGDGPVLVGQMSSWTLRLSNIGTAPASQLSLKTNMPWISTESNKETTDLSSKEDLPAPHCVGPSGTLMNLPLEDESLEAKGVLHPDESVDIPVLIRPSDSGNHSLYMLYRYELCDPSSASTKRRWLQNMINVPVSPSLALTASLMPSFWKQNEHVLSVEVSNSHEGNLVPLQML
jgi:trafficking protein particle complex subunit 8